MSGIDLTIDDIERKFERLRPVNTVAPGVFEGFARGAGNAAMRGFAKTAAAVDMVGAVGPIIQDTFTGGTTAQDRYFKEHDDLYGRAIDYWTPKPNEVGVAGQVVGEILHILPTVFLSPSLAVGATQMATAEELVKLGVPATKAQQVGAIQGGGLGLGIWVPIFGRSLWERMLVGGAGFNVVQGTAMRAGSETILKDTPAAEMFKALDPAELTIDVLLGLAFGGMAHLSPQARQQGKEGWEKIGAFLRRATPEQQEALLAMRQAQHINVDSLPGKPVTPADQNAHVDRVRTALDQMVREEPINVQEVRVETPEGARDPQFTPVPDETAQARGADLVAEAERVRADEGLPPVPEPVLPLEQRPIYRAVREGLEATGRFGGEEYGAYAKTVQAFFEAMGRRMGLTPEALFEQYPLRVTGEAPGARALEQARKETQADIERVEGQIAALREDIGRFNARVNLDHPRVRTVLQQNPNGSLTIEGIQVADKGERGKGHGAAVMRDVTKVADREGKGMLLMAYPEDANAMPLGKLVEWYRRFGFEPLPEQEYSDAVTMYREPRGETRESTQGPESQSGRGLPRAGEAPGETGAGQTGPGTLFQSGQVAPRFYSELQRQLEGLKLDSATPEQWKGTLKNLKGVKKDEIEWSGINEWLDIQQGKVTKQDVLAFLEHNGVKVEEVLLGKPVVAGKNIDEALAREGYRHEWDAVEEEGVYYDRDNELVDFDDLPQNLQDIINRETAGSTTDLDTLTDRLSNLGWETQRTDGEALFRAAQGRSGWMNYAGLERLIPNQSIVLEQARAYRDAIEGEPARPTKFSQYTLPGGENYRELLLTLPRQGRDAEVARGERVREIVRMRDSGQITHEEAESLFAAPEMTQGFDEHGRSAADFRSSHFDEPNVLAHVRFNDRTDSDGAKVLFIEEFQSDWAQQGKKRGFESAKKEIADIPDQHLRVMLKELPKPSPEEVAQNYTSDYAGDMSVVRELINDNLRGDREGYNVTDATTIIRDVLVGDYNWTERAAGDLSRRLSEYGAARTGVPSAPFVTKTDAWVGLSLKRMIAWAVENGYDRVAWTRGEQQVERYTGALRKAVDEIEWTKTDKGVQIVGFEWTKTDKGVQIVGYKGGRDQTPDRPAMNNLRADVDGVLRENDNLGFDSPSEARQAILDHADWAQRWDLPPGTHTLINNWRRVALGGRSLSVRNKVVDTTEREDALSDAIGKSMANKILADPAQSGTISGEGIRVDDTGMASFYDRIVPNIANDILKKMGGKKVGETTIETGGRDRGNTDVEPSDGHETIELRPFRRDDQMAFGGAEPFQDGRPPLIGEAVIKINGRDHDAQVIMGREVVEVLAMHPDDVTGADPISFQMDIPNTIKTQAEAKAWLEKVWTQPGWWGALNLINGRVPNLSKQPAFDITPEMRQNAIKGQALFQGGRGAERGYFEFGALDDPSRIGLLGAADRTTFIHESGHFFLDVTMDLGRRRDAPPELKKDIDTLFKWWGVKRGEWDGMSFEEKRPFHEQFARGFEKYVGEGKAPTPELQSLFDRFKEWLLDVYKTLTSLNVKLNDDIRGVMDRMLGGEVETTAMPRARIGERPTLLGDIKELGGIEQGHMLDITGEARFGRGIKGVPWGLFKRGGKGLDDLATQLRDQGWPIPEDSVDGGVQALRDMVRAEMETPGEVTRIGDEGLTEGEQIEANADEVFQRYAELEAELAEKYGFRDSDPRYQAEIKRLRNERDNALVDTLSGQGDMIGAEARRVVLEAPDSVMVLGEKADGTAETTTAREYLDQAEAEYQRALEESKLFNVAAECMIGA